MGIGAAVGGVLGDFATGVAGRESPAGRFVGVAFAGAAFAGAAVIGAGWPAGFGGADEMEATGASTASSSSDVRLIARRRSWASVIPPQPPQPEIDTQTLASRKPSTILRIRSSCAPAR